MFDGVEGDTKVEAEVDGKRRKDVVQNLETAPTGGLVPLMKTLDWVEASGNH